jgi:hypothetical protein
VGEAQSTGTLGHAAVSQFLAWKAAFNPNVERVTLDLGYKRLMEGVKDMVFKRGPRPDVGVRYKDGSVKVTEVLSKTDNAAQVVARNEIKMMQEGLKPNVETSRLAVWINSLFGK